MCAARFEAATLRAAYVRTLCSAETVADGKECTKSSAIALGFLRAQPSKAAWRRDCCRELCGSLSSVVSLAGGIISGGKLTIERSGVDATRLREGEDWAR